jgi:hypothetical protein
MKGYNNLLECEHCNIKYELKETGELRCINGETLFNTIPKWYKYQREEVKKEVENNQYLLDTDVDVIIMKDTYSLYEVGSGHLIHNIEGFNLKLDDGSLDYNYSSKTSYSINSDIYWYQLGDVICIGDYNIQYYCIPKQKDVVAKARLAAEEMYKINKQK